MLFFFLNYFSREGRNQYEKAFGVDAKDLFQALYRFVERTPTHSFIFPLCFFVLSLSVSLSTLPSIKTHSWGLLVGGGRAIVGKGGRGVCEEASQPSSLSLGVFVVAGHAWSAVGSKSFTLGALGGFDRRGRGPAPVNTGRPRGAERPRSLDETQPGPPRLSASKPRGRGGSSVRLAPPPVSPKENDASVCLGAGGEDVGASDEDTRG